MRLFFAILWLSIIFDDVCRAWIEEAEQHNPDSEFWTTSDNLKKDVTPVTRSPESTDETKKRLEYIKALIIKKLGLEHAPVLNVPMSVPSNLNDLLQSDFQSDYPAEFDEPDDFFSETKKVIIFARTRPHTTDCCYFKFTPDVRQNKISRAYLWLYVQPGKINQDTVGLLKIYGLLSQTKNEARAKYLLNETKIDTSRHSGWISFNIKRTVRYWVGQPSTNWGIEIVSPNVVDLVVTGPIETGNNKLPYLEIQTAQHRHTRSERSAAPDCPSNEEVNYCCRHPLVVNFTELGYSDWILQPKSYDAYYCSGECRLMNPYNPYLDYSILVSTHGIQQCCNPAKMSGIQIIFFTDSYTIKVDTLHDVVVKKCVCS
ncbi:growth/differentiation factor 11-like [Saccoglossus kowalevskii]|uniref:Growth/differentiation factor 11-like n=1 Tax=Saccoglossus kowalevskii TaxID=10224 RepID=A0ABM0M3Z0_SACKO|nr:PREDICTED: growth/differentiation factor 11-like [Saccoglossus kowalevskii]